MTGVTVGLVLLFAVLAGVALGNAVQANQKATEAAIAQAAAVAAQQNSGDVKASLLTRQEKTLKTNAQLP